LYRCHPGSYRRKPAHGSQTTAAVTGRRSKKIGTLRHRSAGDFELLNGCATSRPWFDFEGLNPPIGQMYPSKRVEIQTRDHTVFGHWHPVTKVLRIDHRQYIGGDQPRH